MVHLLHVNSCITVTQRALTCRSGTSTHCVACLLLQANLSEHDLEELEEAEAWIVLQAELAEQEEEQEQLLFQ